METIPEKIRNWTSPVHPELWWLLAEFRTLQRCPDPSDLDVKIALRRDYIDFIDPLISIVDDKLTDIHDSTLEPNRECDLVQDLFAVLHFCVQSAELVDITAEQVYDGRVRSMRFNDQLYNWGYFQSAEDGGFELLARLRSLPDSKKKGVYMPSDTGPLLAKDAVVIVTSIVKSFSRGGSKKMSDYQRVFSLVADLDTWFRHDRNDGPFLQLVKSLQVVTQNLMSELCEFNGQLFLDFFELTISIISGLVTHPELKLHEFLRFVCFGLISNHQTELDNLSILNYILKSSAQLFKVGDFVNTSLLCDLIDMLAVKGIVKFHQDIYTMMSSVCGEADKQKLLSILWDSGRLNHSLCVSLVCDELLKKLSNAFNKEVETVEFWKKCFKSSLQSLTGVIQISSYFFSTVPHDSLDDKNVVHPFRDVKSAVEKLKLQPWSSESNFRRGYLLYYLGDKLISTGNFFEALSRAEDALQLRAELFVVSFSEIYKLLESEFICFETWCSHEMNWDGEGLYISPWKALQCYLESILQVGCINEVIGHGREAEHYFTLGKNISQKQNIPLFISSFSSALGNLEMKKKSWNRSLHELNNARGTLEKCEALSCENCCSMQRISIEMHLAHVSRKTYCNERKDVTFRGSCVAEHWYTSALSKLKSEWSDFPKNLQEVEDELKNCSVSSTQPDTISMGKPESLLDCISLKRKLVRRKLYLGILSGQAKLLEFSNRIDGAAENIMQRISVLRGSSPLTQPDSFSSLTSLLMLVAREYSEDPFAIERAYFLYSVCWFSLKNKKPSESRTTSCVRFVELKDAVTLLKKAFVLSREVPALLQKVSKLLSVICILPSKMNFSLPSHSQELSESHWAAYFHQASIGTNLMKKMLQKCSEQTGSTSEADTCRLLRFQLPHFHVSVSIM